MSPASVNKHPYPFHFSSMSPAVEVNGIHRVELRNVRGARASLQASQLRTMMLEASSDPAKIVAMTCSYDALSSKLVEQAGFPAIFVSGFPVAASLGLPDTGYIAFSEMTQRIQEIIRQVNIPVIVDGDTGYGGPMNVKRTVQGFALAGAAGVMIEDQTWPKRCGHTEGKAVVPEDEAYARIQAAVDARDGGLDIWILARTDSLIHGYEEARKRARRFIDIGVDAVFIEAMPDRATMDRMAKDLEFPCMANMIPGGRTEIVPPEDLAAMGYSAVAYPFTLIAAKINAVRNALEELKLSFSSNSQPVTMPAKDVFEAVGFLDYYREEEKYRYGEKGSGSAGLE